MPRKRTNPLNDFSEQQPTPQSTPTATPHPTASAIEIYGGLQLPETLAVELPDISGLAQSAIGTPETGFAPNPNLPRVSEADRAAHAQAFAEQRNAAMNLRDSIAVANEYVNAGIAATKLGKGLVRYATGVEEIREATVQLQSAQTKTAIANTRLGTLTDTHEFMTAERQIAQETFQHRLVQLQQSARAEAAKATEMIREIDERYGYIEQNGG